MKQNTIFQKSVSVITLVAFVALSSFIYSFDIVSADTLANNMDAAYVIGDGSATQDFTDADAGTTASTFTQPRKPLYDADNNRLFVIDTGNQRVLVFNTDSAGLPLDYTADYVLGQPDFTSSGNETDQNSFMGYSRDMEYDSVNDYLFVADGGRVMVFDLSGGITNGMNASYVLGQPDFVTNIQTTGQATTTEVSGLTYRSDVGYLFVRDNYRTLIFDLSGGITSGMNALGFFGQNSFAGEDTGISTTRYGVNTSNTAINDVAYDASDALVFVGDSVNGRILVYNANDGNNVADYVIGQSNFTTGTDGGTTQSTFNQEDYGNGLEAIFTFSVDAANDRLFVNDTLGHRVLVFDYSGGITNGMNASYVLGQSGFNLAASDTNIKGFSGVTSSYFNTADNYLYTSEYSNNRVLIFDLTPSAQESVMGNGQVTSFRSLMTDQAPSANADHQIEFQTSTAYAAGDTLVFTWPSGWDVSNIAHTDVDISDTTNGELSLAADCTGSEEASVSSTAQVLTITLCAGDGGALASGETITIEIGTNASGGSNQITNPSSAGSHLVLLSGTQYGTTYVAITENVNVSASMGASFTFVVGGVSSGTAAANGVTGCNGDGNVDVTTTATSIPFGTISTDTPYCASQVLTVTSNASGGHTVTVYGSNGGALQNDAGDDIDIFADGSNGAPAVWASPSATPGSEDTYGHWGVTSSDATLSGGDTFGSALFDAVGGEATPLEVFYHDGASDGSTDGAGATTVLYKIEASSLQEFGDYTETVHYVATPVF